MSTVNCDIFQAIIKNDMDELKQILGRSSKEALATPFRGTTPLSFAVYRANLPSVVLLIDSGAPLNKRSVDHLQRIETPLTSSIRLGHFEIFLKLLQSGADMNALDYYSHCPLWYAVKEQRLPFVKHLLAEGAPITFPNSVRSPFNLVIQYSSYKTRRLFAIELIYAGLQLDLSYLGGMRPAEFPIKFNDFPLFRIMIEAGSKYLKDIRNPSPKFPEGWMNDPVISDWINQETTTPQSLLRQCRIVIRSHLRLACNRDLRPIIKKLQLPQVLISYLLLENISIATQK